MHDQITQLLRPRLDTLLTLDCQLRFTTVNCSTAVLRSDAFEAVDTALAQSTSLAESFSILWAVTVTNLITSGSEHLKI